MSSVIVATPVERAARNCLPTELLRERAARRAHLAAWISRFPELVGTPIDRLALAAACWFHDVGRLDGSAFAAPDEPHLERAAEFARRQLADVLEPATLQACIRTLRGSIMRNTAMPEALILREAVNLDAIGPTWLLTEAARSVVQGKPWTWLVEGWQRQSEYQYWEGRITESLRFEPSRRLARMRCRAIEPFMAALGAQLGSTDIGPAAPGTPT